MHRAESALVLHGRGPGYRVRAGQAPDVILVIEDDAAFRKDVCIALEDAGFLTIGAASGRDALEWLESGPIRPSLIVLDLAMEPMDGEAFHARLSLDRRNRGIPIVVISARDDVERVSQRLGTRAFLAKPFRPEALIDLVEMLC